MRHEIGASSDIPEGAGKAFSIGAQKIAVFHLSDGFYATQAKCSHLFAPLAKGKVLDDRCVQCPFHRARFDIRSGEVLEWATFPPGVQLLNPLRQEKSLQTWPVHEEAGKLYIDL